MAEKATSGITGANLVSKAEFGQYYPTVTVVNWGTEGVLWVRTDNVAPIIAEDENYPVLPGERVSMVNGNLTSDPNSRVTGGTTVLLISSVAIPFTVYCF